LAYRGEYAESETELAMALKIFVKQNGVQGQGVTWAYRALCELLRLRTVSQSANREPHSAIESARRALELADEVARTVYPVERDSELLISAVRPWGGSRGDSAAISGVR
ncbi:MAG: hypothetical protein QF749_13775, partial [Verrucomicrobiota bacterium]|nr:hypothetical protein [Verrucomicrobiota bacterium]